MVSVPSSVAHPGPAWDQGMHKRASRCPRYKNLTAQKEMAIGA